MVYNADADNMIFFSERGKIILYLLLFAGLGFTRSVFAVTSLDLDFLSAPTTNDNGGVYTGTVGNALMHVTCGSLQEYLSTGGWNGTGGAKFTVHDGAQCFQSYAGLVPNNYQSINWPQLNMRLLIKFSNGFAANCGASGAKFNITSRVNGIDVDRTWIGLHPIGQSIGGGMQVQANHQNTIYFVHGGNTSCPNTDYDHIAACDPTNFHRCTNGCPPLRVDDYENQWIALEWEVNNAGGVKVYAWTQDGVFNGPYLWTDDQGPHLNIAGVVDIGGFWGGPCANGANYVIDNLKISDSYIGPPDGFIGTSSDTTPPAAPSGLAII